jgi:hypothetical protein
MKHISIGGLDVEENTAADRIELSAGQIERLNNLAPGERHDEGNMAVIDR